jgi:hypothetical protein
MGNKRLSLTIIRISLCMFFCNEGVAQFKDLTSNGDLNFYSAYFSRVQNKYKSNAQLLHETLWK